MVPETRLSAAHAIEESTAPINSTQTLVSVPLFFISIPSRSAFGLLSRGRVTPGCPAARVHCSMSGLHQTPADACDSGAERLSRDGPQPYAIPSRRHLAEIRDHSHLQNPKPLRMHAPWIGTPIARPMLGAQSAEPERARRDICHASGASYIAARTTQASSQRRTAYSPLGNCS